MHLELLEYCNEIDTHIAQNCSVGFLSGNFYFKFDAKNRPYLIYATCIKTDHIVNCLNGDKLVLLGLLSYCNIQSAHRVVEPSPI